MNNKDHILEVSKKRGTVRMSDFLVAGGVSRQTISSLLARLVAEGELIKVGSTRATRYVHKTHATKEFATGLSRYEKRFIAKGLEEHKVIDDIERRFAPFKKLPENVRSIFVYAFSEMLNNAIEHAGSKEIKVTVSLEKGELAFTVDDFGIGVFRNIMKKRNLHSELEAIQDLLKGKTTTAPKLHSGEGIFFTSKVGDGFSLESYGRSLLVDNVIEDLFVAIPKGRTKQGTKVTFRINTAHKGHLNDVFRRYTDIKKGGDFGFDKTEIRVRLYTMGGVHISRSQARRILSGLDKFSVVIMDYTEVPMIGQAFADEIYRIFKEKHPEIRIENEHMNEAVSFMIQRATAETKRKPHG